MTLKTRPSSSNHCFFFFSIAESQLRPVRVNNTQFKNQHKILFIKQIVLKQSANTQSCNFTISVHFISDAFQKNACVIKRDHNLSNYLAVLTSHDTPQHKKTLFLLCSLYNLEQTTAPLFKQFSHQPITVMIYFRQSCPPLVHAQKIFQPKFKMYAFELHLKFPSIWIIPFKPTEIKLNK